MKVISYSRLFQLPGGKSESERIALKAELSPHEDPIPHMETLKHLAYRCSTRFTQDAKRACEVLTHPEAHNNHDVLWAEDFTDVYGIQVPKKPKQTRLKI